MPGKTTLIQHEGQAPHAQLDSERDFDLAQVRKAVNGIQYGEVRVIIQDGVVVQIERLEKHRLR